MPCWKLYEDNCAVCFPHKPNLRNVVDQSRDQFVFGSCGWDVCYRSIASVALQLCETNAYKWQFDLTSTHWIQKQTIYLKKAIPVYWIDMQWTLWRESNICVYVCIFYLCTLISCQWVGFNNYTLPILNVAKIRSSWLWMIPTAFQQRSCRCETSL